MNIKEIAVNRKASHEYTIIESFEAGIELAGTEVKSIRNGRINLKDSFAIIKDGEVILRGMHISPYEFGNINNKEPLRDRKLLVHKAQILKLLSSIKQDGYTIIPLKMYFKGRIIKLQIGICKGKKIYDKRDDIKKKETIRELQKQKYQ